MIQLNLLPDVKLQYIRARHRKRLVVGISMITSAAFLAILISMFLFVRVGQKKHLNDLDKDITTASQTLSGKPELDKVLTVQNQLKSLDGLHDSKVVSSRLFEFLSQVTPKGATISDVTVDFQLMTITIVGNANSLGTVNTFVDTLKFTEYETDPTNENRPEKADPRAFSGVVLGNFALSTAEEKKSAGAENVSYDIRLSFQPAIFANLPPNQTNNTPVRLKVPNQVTTQSEVAKPDDNLFEQNQLDQLPSGQGGL